MTGNELDGVGVLVTRPGHQAGDLVAAIRARGGDAVRFPVMEIVGRDRDSITKEEKTLQQPAVTIFVSPNAVRHGWPYAAGARVAAVGPTTAAAIESAGGKVDIRSTSGYDSEHLLDLDELRNITGKVVRIVRGGHGRELLANTQRDRAATDEYLAVYDRRLPNPGAAESEALESEWRSGAIDVVTLMSVESLQNLIALLPASCKSLLQNTPLVTPAARVIKEALKRLPGIQTTLARGPSPRDMVDAIIASTKT